MYIWYKRRNTITRACSVQWLSNASTNAKCAPASVWVKAVYLESMWSDLFTDTTREMQDEPPSVKESQMFIRLFVG